MRYNRNMFLYGLSGLIIGFVAGMAANAYLLQGTPREDYLNNKDMRMKYGALNWAIAALGMIVALIAHRYR